MPVGRQSPLLGVSLVRYPTQPSRRLALTDQVAVDAKRILLRYGTPITVLDRVGDEERIKLARLITRTPLAEREPRLKELLQEAGHL